MFLTRNIVRWIEREVRQHSVVSVYSRSLAIRSSLVPRKKRDYISSDGIDKDQLTPALQQYYKFKEQYKGMYLYSDFIRRLCVILSLRRLL